MGNIHVTCHAIERYRERVANLSDDEARARLSTPFIRAAANFGNCEVILPSGHRAVIAQHTVITVRPLFKPKRRNRGDKE